MRRLYFRIYLAVLASLALFAMLAGMTWRTFYGFENLGPRLELYLEAAERLAPPASASPAEQQRQIEHWQSLSGYELAIFGPDGRVIAQAADGTLPSPLGFETRSRSRPWRGPYGIHAVQLRDGRWLMAARPRADRGWLSRFGWLAALLGIAGAVGIAAYPVVRRLTRELERLESSVVALGAGDLSSRAKIEGRDEVARLAASFNLAADRIEQLIQSNKSLLANASHELRSPLGRLRMGLEAVQGSVPAASREELARNIRELDQLIEEILLASRLEAQGGDQAAFEHVDLLALAAEECAMTGAEITTFPAEGAQVSADPRLLRRLIRNLLENAKRYGAGSPVDVALRSTAAAMEIDVLDRGPGVPPAEREHIFEPFYRPPGTRERDGSVGLGLSLTRQIAKRHGGTVVCLPRDGGGSCFRISLPRSRGA
jgi:signal transduction histidine kinase